MELSVELFVRLNEITSKSYTVFRKIKKITFNYKFYTIISLCILTAINFFALLHPFYEKTYNQLAIMLKDNDKKI